MKNILSLITGIVIIIFSNVLLNFGSSSPKIEPIVIYVIMLAIFSESNKYYLYFLGLFFGFLQDASVGRYSSLYAIAFLLMMIAGEVVKHQIRREYFLVSFFSCFIFVLSSTLYFSLLSGSTLSLMEMAKINLIYILKTMAVCSIILLILCKIKGRDKI